MQLRSLRRVQVDVVPSRTWHCVAADMPIDLNALSALAADYAKGMTSIRGRRVQRLLKREFAGADVVLIVEVASGGSAVLGLSESGAAIVATDGRGRNASVCKWLHGSTEATEVRFDLLRDSLPVSGRSPIPLSGLPKRADLHVPSGAVPREANLLLARALAALA
ncbi:MAG: hypothetical protein ABIV63_21570 [Caldimonas sp.]